MNQELTWLSISLFCSTGNWHQLLSEGIKQFIKPVEDENLLVSYLLELNYVRGENIRFSLLTYPDHADELAKKADTFFKDYFFRMKFPDSKITYPVASVFMQFPSNSVQYGIYDINRAVTKENLKDFHFRKNLSGIMLEVLEEPVDKEIVLTFALYLHITLACFIKGHMKLDMGKFVHFYSAFIDKSKVENPVPDNMEIKSEFEENREALISMKQEIIQMNYTTSNDEASWLVRYGRLLSEEINMRMERNERPELIHVQLAFIIRQHLGIPNTMESFILYLLAELFRDDESEIV